MKNKNTNATENLFDLDSKDFKEEKKSSSTDVFKPHPDKGKEGVYSAVVRFVTWYKDPKKSINKKFTCWLEDPLTDTGKYVDCPSSVGKPSIINDIFWKLKNSESASDQKLTENFSRRPVYASIVQIIKNDNDPDSVGKLMVWNYGMKIHTKIQEQIQPDFGEPHIPFDIFNGKPFHVKVQKLGGFNNYDSCKFLDTKQPLLIDGKPIKLTDDPEENQKVKEKVIKFLEENSPDLDRYDYREWDQETTDFVMDVIKNTIPDGKIIEKILKKNNMKTQQTSSKAKIVEDPLKSESSPEPKQSADTINETSDDKSLPALDDDLGDDMDDDIGDGDENFDSDLYKDL